MIWNPRGSIWRRWDPHIHAPGTLFEDSFGGDWEAYLKAVEDCSPRIRALGVTDYFCIQTYKEVRKRKADGRLKEIEFVFPNVEMRLEIKTAKQQGINLHLLFSPDDPQHEIAIERILGRLHFRFGEQDYACNKQELIDLGRAFDSKQTDERGAHKTGANLFKVSFPELQKLFRDEHKWLSKNCLVAVAGSKNDGTAGTRAAEACRWPCIWRPGIARLLRRLPACSYPCCASLVSRPTLGHRTSGSAAIAGFSPCRGGLPVLP
jgi:hypothetical protein